jgi:hypothetical protein
MADADSVPQKGARVSVQRWMMWTLLGVLPIGVGSSVAQAPAPTPPPTAARVTLTLEAATLSDAATALSRAIRLPVLVPEDMAAKYAGRRARLALANASLSQALRQFCTAFDCTVAWEVLPDAPGCGFLVRSGPAPQGPEARLPGYRVAVLGLTFTDRRSFDEDSAAVFADRSVGLHLAARAENGDIGPIESMENIRIVDQNGRDALAPMNDRDGDEPEGEPDTTLPDEQPQRFLAEWPYPAPHRLKLIEGELVLYKKVRRATLRIPVPAEGAPPTTLRFGDARAQLAEDVPGQRYLLRITHGTEQELAFAGEFPFLAAALPDGTQLPLNGAVVGRSEQQEGVVEEIWIPSERKAGRPTHLIVRLALRSEPGRRMRFRIENFPATLAPSEDPAPRPVRLPATPLPGNSPVKPKSMPDMPKAKPEGKL